MGRWTYDWRIRYYGSGGWLKDICLQAKTRQEALKKLRELVPDVVEVYCCRRTDTW